MFRLSYECSYNLSWSREATPRNWTCLHEQHNRGYGSRFLDIVMKLDRKALERGYWSWRRIKSVSENVGRRKDIVAEGKEGIDHKRSRRKKHCLYSLSTPFMSKYARIRGRYHIAIDASENSIFTRATLMFHLFYTRNDESRSETLWEIEG